MNLDTFRISAIVCLCTYMPSLSAAMYAKAAAITLGDLVDPLV